MTAFNPTLGRDGPALAYPIRQGVASAVAPDAPDVDGLRRARRHALLCDFDGDRLPRVRAAMAAAMRLWRLPDVRLYASGSPGGYHAISLCARPLVEIAAIARYVRSDALHRQALGVHGFNVLRVSPKAREDGSIALPAPRHVETVASPYPDEARAEWLFVLDYSMPLAGRDE